MIQARRIVPLALFCASVCSAAPITAATQELLAACQADSSAEAGLSGIQVRAVAASGGDLPYYEASSAASGASVRIYHDPELTQAAASKSACLMGMLDLLPAAMPGLPPNSTWSPMVITRNANYVPLRRDGELRWVNVFRSSQWDAAAIDFLVVTMPHEQVHLVQGKDGIQLPRWFQEGHAEWAGLQVTMQVRPDLASKQRLEGWNAYRDLGAARLGAWGSIQVKPAAIERQLTAEDRERKAKDPSYNPPGPFSFGPDDFEQDMGGERGRYGAALALFDTLEMYHGRDKVREWVRAVLASKDPKRIVELAREVLGQDIAPLLK